MPNLTALYWTHAVDRIALEFPLLKLVNTIINYCYCHYLSHLLVMKRWICGEDTSLLVWHLSFLGHYRVIVSIFCSFNTLIYCRLGDLLDNVSLDTSCINKHGTLIYADWFNKKGIICLSGTAISLFDSRKKWFDFHISNPPSPPLSHLTHSYFVSIKQW